MAVRHSKWFDRKFDFNNNHYPFTNILERLRGAPVRLKEKIRITPSHLLKLKPDNTWSIQENAGHLADLEPLWQGRLQDILNGERNLRHADLTNRKTDEANHNAREIEEIIDDFERMRKDTVASLEKIDSHQLELSALHPRLKTPMRITDLFLFVAEHDDHHLARMHEIILQNT